MVKLNRMNRITLLFLIVTNTSFSQNLVGNPSFESYSECPPNIGLGYEGYIHFASGWLDLYPTSDFYHVCGELGGGVPNNFWGYQEAYSGNGYAGFTTHNPYYSNGNEGLTRELEETLIVDSTYYCSFKVNLAGTTGNGSNRIGMRFTTYLEHYEPEDYELVELGNFAHVYTDVIITDTINWVHFQGDFVADSAYTHVGLSNFFEDEYTSLSEGAGIVYYYVDDICVSLNPEDCGIIPCSEVTVSIDTTVCFPFKLPSGSTLYSAVDFYNDTLITLNGCDSILMLNFTSNTTYSSIEESACDNYISPSGIVYSESGIYIDTIMNVLECDSIITINLSVNNSDTTNLSLIFCDEFEWYGSTYLETGLYEHVLTNTNGCDSTLALDLVINYSSLTDTTILMCDSLNWVDSTYYESGIIENTYPNILGCDSTVQIDLTINHSYSHDTSHVACNEFYWYGSNYTESGSYEKLFMTETGCDSIINLELIILNSSVSDTNATVCNEFYWYEDHYTESGEYERLFTTVDGCDSLVTLSLIVHESDSTIDEITTCQSYVWIDGIEYLEDNTEAYYSTTNINGCDSVIQLNLDIVEVDVNLTIESSSILANLAGADYQWLNCENEFAEIDGANDQIFFPVINGNYAIEITYMGCIDTSECALIDYFTEIKKEIISNFTISPNPFDDFTIIKFDKSLSENHTVIIYDILGQEVYLNESVTGQSLEIKKEQLGTGIYILSLLNPNSEELFNAKLLVE